MELCQTAKMCLAGHPWQMMGRKGNVTLAEPTKQTGQVIKATGSTMKLALACQLSLKVSTQLPTQNVMQSTTT
jgi:hypothetical protein